MCLMEEKHGHPFRLASIRLSIWRTATAPAS
jgi:hypothetical protein